MTIMLCTVPHTGTQFFRQLLDQHFRPVGFAGFIAGEQGYIACHVTDFALDMIEQANHQGHRPVLITTKRHPSKVTQSWMRRGKNLRDLDEFYRRHKILSKFDPLVVSVDQDKEARLRALEQRLGVEFDTDWAPVNQWKEGSDGD